MISTITPRPERSQAPIRPTALPLDAECPSRFELANAITSDLSENMVWARHVAESAAAGDWDELFRRLMLVMKMPRQDFGGMPLRAASIALMRIGQYATGPEGSAGLTTQLLEFLERTRCRPLRLQEERILGRMVRGDHPLAQGQVDAIARLAVHHAYEEVLLALVDRGYVPAEGSVGPPSREGNVWGSVGCRLFDRYAPVWESMRCAVLLGQARPGGPGVEAAGGL